MGLGRLRQRLLLGLLALIQFQCLAHGLMFRHLRRGLYIERRRVLIRIHTLSERKRSDVEIPAVNAHIISLPHHPIFLEREHALSGKIGASLFVQSMRPPCLKNSLMQLLVRAA